MECVMSSSTENRSPEVSGLVAANSGFGLVEGAIMPASRRLAPAALWLITAFCLATLAAAAGITSGGEPSAKVALDEIPAAPEPTAAAPQPVRAPVASAEERVLPIKHPRALPVVLRGQPSRAATGS
jgi:hypothetical protein